MNAARSGLFLLLAALGCNNQRPVTVADVLPTAAVRVPDVQAELDKVFADFECICFRSRDGCFIGDCGDLDIELHLGETAVLIAHGSAEHLGTYSINESSVLSLVLTRYGDWPPMHVCRDGSNLLLVPADSSMKSLEPDKWPFRQITRTE